MKTNFKQLTNPLYMGAYSMDNGDNTYCEIHAVTRSFKQEEVSDPTGKKKMCLIGYTDQPKPFILNATAQKVMQQITKSRYLEDWVNVPITFYVAINVRTPQGPVDALRIKPRAAEQKEDLTMKERMLRECKTMEDLKVIYSSFTPAQQAGTVKVKDEMKAKLAAV